MYVFLDTETTGLSHADDHILEIALVDDLGDTLLESFVRPPDSITAWPKAQAVNGISPEMVADAPPLGDLMPLFTQAIEGRIVVAYNAKFDAGFFPREAISRAAGVACCQVAWNTLKADWIPQKNRYKRHRLKDASAEVGFDWPDGKQAHRARLDALACRAVWHEVLGIRAKALEIGKMAAPYLSPDLGPAEHG